MTNGILLPHSDISEKIIGCCFDVMTEVGSGFLESVYKNALYIAMKDIGLDVEVEKAFEVKFRDYVIGKYNADLIVNNTIIIESKSCKCLVPDHQAQLINYLKVSGLPVGLLVNFGNQKLEYKRLHHPDTYISYTKK